MMDGTKDHKEKENMVVEVANSERHLWSLVNCKGISHPDVHNLYCRICFSYEKIILQNSELSELQDVEYSLWKLHYKHIDEFRKTMKNSSSNVGRTNSNHMEGFKLFLSEASEFYTSLLLKLRSRWIPKENMEPNKATKWQFLCHRFLICLGDLARYRELFRKQEDQNPDWSTAAEHYLEACGTWPDGGNPHNQLALLATYVGDDFLALYHCVRSLAVKEPFPDASNNLMLILEKSRSSPLHSSSEETPFDFLRPSDRRHPQIKNGRGSAENKLWVLFVRMISFFYIDSRLEEFPSTFAATMRELDLLMELDAVRLEEALISNRFTASTKTGPLQMVQAVCTFIFVIQNLLKNPLTNSQEKEKSDHPVIRRYAISSTFIFMGRLVDRCTKDSSSSSSSPLLPSILVFMEWLVTVCEEVNSSNEVENAAICYFFGSLVQLLNQIEAGRREVWFQGTALWEDFELRGFAPAPQALILLDFSASSASVGNFRSGNLSRARRLIAAAKSIADKSRDWISHDESRKRFFVPKSDETRDVDCQGNEESGTDPVEEEEVILFKPLTRYNSAPIHNVATFKDHPSETELSFQTASSDECLRRATSLVQPQNLRDSNNADFFKPSIKPFNAFPESSITAGPPSLSAWVINGGSLTAKGTNEGSKASLSPIDELTSASLANLSIHNNGNGDYIPNSGHDSLITTPYPSAPYCAPVPSAPLLPEDAAWFYGNEDSAGFSDMIMESSYSYATALQENNHYSNLVSHDVIYPISCGMSSSEWLRQFREMNNLQGPGMLGNFEAPGFRCGAGTLFGPSNQMGFFNSKPSHPDFTNIYQRPSPYVRDDQLTLLQYLKDSELRLQQDPSFPGRMFLGK